MMLLFIIFLLLTLSIWITRGEAWGLEALQRFLELPSPPGGEYQKILKHKAEALGFQLRYGALDIFDLVLGQLYARADFQTPPLFLYYLQSAYACRRYFLEGSSRPQSKFIQVQMDSTFAQSSNRPDLNSPLLMLGLFKLSLVPSREARKIIRILESSIRSLPSLNAQQWEWLQGCLRNPELSSLFSLLFQDFVRQAKPQRSSWKGHAATGTSMSLSKIYSTLGIHSAPPVADSEVRSAYLRLMRKLHPDKLRSQSLSEAEVQAKLRHAQEVQLAFQTWKRSFAASSSV